MLPPMQFGPIQMLVVGFDGNRFRGEIWPELERLKREGIVRIIDLMLVRKDTMGGIAHVKASDLDWEEATAFGEVIGTLAGFAAGGAEGAGKGALAGIAELMDGHLFDEEDAFRLEQVMEPGTTVAVVLFEHLWSLPLLQAVVRARGFELLNEWVRPEAVLAAGSSFALGAGDEGAEPSDEDLSSSRP
jgi:uncharacterized membrane protein